MNSRWSHPVKGTKISMIQHKENVEKERKEDEKRDTWMIGKMHRAVICLDKMTTYEK